MKRFSRQTRVPLIIGLFVLFAGLGVLLGSFNVTPTSHAQDIPGPILNPPGGPVNDPPPQLNTESGAGIIGNALKAALGWLIAKWVYLISYLVSYIAGVVIGLLGWITAVLLDMNTKIINSTLVQTGFSITISLANLGFVIAITVIAIATILRREQYGIKQILWKVIAAAVLINFSLVIVGPILGLADQLATYFLKCSIPQASGGGCSSSAGGYMGMNQFAGTLVGAFNPQRNFLSVGEASVSTNSTAGIEGALSNTATFGETLKPIASLVFTAAMLTVIVVTLWAFNIMLFTRYIILGILFVLMPFAWLMWIFPNLKHLWTKWWNTFFRWTFFAPIVIFFLYLAIVTSSALGTAGATEGDAMKNLYTTNNSQTNSIFAAAATFLTATFTPLLGALLQGFVVVGLAVGGLFAANSLSIHGASAAMKILGTARGWAQGYVGRQAKKAGRYVYERGVKVPFTEARVGPQAKKFVEAMQQSRVPGVSAIGRAFAGFAKGGGAGLVNTILKEAEGKSSVTLGAELKGYAGKERQFAYLQELHKRGDLDEVKTINGKALPQFLLENEAVFNRYDQKKLYENLNKAFAQDAAVNAAAAAAAKGNVINPGATVVDEKGILGAAGATVNALELLKESARGVAKTLSVSDIQKGQIDAFFLDPDKAEREGKLVGASNKEEYKLRAMQIADAFSKSASSQVFAELMKKLAKGGSQDQFEVYMHELTRNRRADPKLAAKLGRAPTIDDIKDDIFSPAAQRWLDSNSARDLGVDINRWVS